MLVLAPGVVESIGIDLATGCFVRAGHPPTRDLARTFEVVEGEVADATEPPDGARPEALELTDAPRRVGRMGRRRAVKRLVRLAHPRRVPILGLATDSVPYWTLGGDRPSVALVELSRAPGVKWSGEGPFCSFAWAGAEQFLPLTDDAAGSVRVGVDRAGRVNLARALGYRPTRLLVILTAPVDGYCRKAVAALLP